MLQKVMLKRNDLKLEGCASGQTAQAREADGKNMTV